MLDHCNESCDMININYTSIGVSELSITRKELFRIVTPSQATQQIFIRCFSHDPSPVVSVWRAMFNVYVNLIKSI